MTDKTKSTPITAVSLFFLTLFSLAIPLPGQAEQAKDFGKYMIHYSAYTTDNLTPSVAKQYNIKRNKKYALLNISVLKKMSDAPGKPASAKVRGTATNLSQQLKELSFREIAEQGAIYYIATTSVNNAEILKYNIEVLPEGEQITHTLAFDQQFYTE